MQNLTYEEFAENLKILLKESVFIGLKKSTKNFVSALDSLYLFEYIYRLYELIKNHFKVLLPAAISWFGLFLPKNALILCLIQHHALRNLDILSL